MDDLAYERMCDYADEAARDAALDREGDTVDPLTHDAMRYASPANPHPSVAAIIRGNGMEWDEPVFLPSQVAYELDEAGVLQYEDETTQEDDNGNKVTVYTYEVA